jgi:hypothetical protein
VTRGAGLHQTMVASRFEVVVLRSRRIVLGEVDSTVPDLNK